MTVYSSSIQHFLTEPDWPKVMLKSLHRHRLSPDVAVRLCFAFGNLLSRQDEAREKLFFSLLDDNQGEGIYSFCLQLLLDIIGHYIDIENIQDTDKISQHADVIKKAVRVVANLSICESVGPLIAANANCVEKLMMILASERLLDEEELKINALATLNNLSYYNKESIEKCSKYEVVDSEIYLHRMQLATLMCQLMLTEDNTSVLTEIARVLGNLTRYKDVRDLISKHKVDLMMVALLDSGDRHLVFNACGTLVNISSDKDKTEVLLDENAVKKLNDVIKDFAPVDWGIPGTACQVLWNLLRYDSIYNDETRDLLESIDILLDRNCVLEQINDVTDDVSTRDGLLTAWNREFYPYAFPLYESLHRRKGESPSHLIPLEGELDQETDEEQSNDT